MEPLDPPLANKVSCTGCHATPSIKRDKQGLILNQSRMNRKIGSRSKSTYCKLPSCVHGTSATLGWSSLCQRPWANGHESLSAASFHSDWTLCTSPYSCARVCRKYLKAVEKDIATHKTGIGVGPCLLTLWPALDPNEDPRAWSAADCPCFRTRSVPSADANRRSWHLRHDLQKVTEFSEPFALHIIGSYWNSLNNFSYVCKGNGEIIQG